MTRWVLRGLKTGVVTTRYPDAPENAPGCTPGLPMGEAMLQTQARELERLCPTAAIRAEGERVIVDYRRCIHCYRCERETSHPLVLPLRIAEVSSATQHRLPAHRRW